MFRILSLGLFGLFIFSLSLLVVLAKQPTCIDSTIVERIDKVAADGLSTVYQCQMQKPVPYDEQLAAEAHLISAHLSHVQRYIRDAGGLQNPIRITWLHGTANTFRIQGSELFLSDEFVLDRFFIERAILKVWLREKAGSLPLDRTLLEESFTDLIQYSLGSFALSEEDKNESLWPKVLQNSSSICKSAWVTPEQKMNCPLVGEKDQLSLTSLRPLLSHALIEIYDQKGFFEKMRFLSEIPKLLVGQDSFRALNLSSVDAQFPSVSDLAKELNASLDFFAGNAVFEDLKGALARHGFRQNENSFRFDYFVFFQTPRKDQNEIIRKFLKQAKEFGLSAAGDGKNLWLRDAEQALPVSSVQKFLTHRLIYLACEVPDVPRLLQIAQMTDQLLFIRACHAGEEITFHKYFTDGAAGFARENPRRSFMQIHVPSLQQAWVNRQINPLPSIVSGEWKGEFFHKSGWRAPIWDESIKAYRAQSVIQAVEIFRN
jgi:hypothetical protein